MPRDELLTFEEIVNLVRVMVPLGVGKIRLTGGEPLLFAEVAELCVALRRAGCHVTVETAGTVLPVTSEQVADLMSISPKLASSTPPADTPQRWATRHEASRRRDDVLRGLAAAGRHQFKFVIDSESDPTVVASSVLSAANLEMEACAKIELFMTADAI